MVFSHCLQPDLFDTKSIDIESFCTRDVYTGGNSAIDACAIDIFVTSASIKGASLRDSYIRNVYTKNIFVKVLESRL